MKDIEISFAVDTRRFTLEEARLELLRMECRMGGHTFDVMTTTGELDPQLVVCGRCGKSWQIAGRIGGPDG